MMRRLLLSLATCMPILHAMAQDGLWSPVPKSSLQTYQNGRSGASSQPVKFELVKLNRSVLQQLQNQAPLVKLGERAASVSPVRISLPLPVAGQSLSSAFTESPVLSTALAQQLTNVKTYELNDPGTNSLQGRLTITPQGVSGLIFTSEGTAYISPVSEDVHMVYYTKDLPVTQGVKCGVTEVLDNAASATNRNAAILAGDCRLRNYRLAVAATGEYTAWAGGTQAQALSYIAALVNDVTAIYERDAAITFTLVSNNSIIFTDAATDPYPTVSFPDGTTLSNNHNTLNTNIGSANFDEGIVVDATWNGGLASVSAVCNNSYKGSGAAGLSFGTGSNPTAGPQGPVFISTVAHEMGHQFSAMHTMASISGSCNGNSYAPTAWEPGGGSTIMAYAASCNPDYYQYYSDLYFHGGSILQITNFAVSTTCRTPTTMSNTAPTVSVPGTSYTIPVSTPFMLTSTGRDGDGNTLYYCWEQMDAGVFITGTPTTTATSGPAFRSYPPTTASTRVFPRLVDIISGAATPYEVLPSVTRAMSFQVMVRDQAAGGGCTAQQTVTVNTNSAAGAFTVTSQSTATSWTANGTNTATIAWNVANTNAAPVSCSNVDIILSTDGGVTFTDTLAANTANDGTEDIVIPNLPTSAGRVMVKARGNIFFNVNTAFITITSSCLAKGASVTPATSVLGAAGSSQLDLSLSPVYGTVVNINGAIQSTDATGYLVRRTTTNGACNFYSNEFLHDNYVFTPSVTGTYTFTKTGDFYTVFTLYSGSYDPSTPCTNLINSSFQYNGSAGSLATSFTATLTAGLYYVFAVGSFDNDGASPALPSNYSFAVTGPGSLYSNTPNPGASYTYTYVIVDNATGLIKAFDASSDLSNATNYPTGTSYTVYGLSYSTSISAATLNTYVGTSYAAFRNALLYNPTTLCGSVSANTVAVTVTSTLASKLQPLTAAKNGNAVKLKWATSSEQNISYYEVWRSIDGNSFDKLVGTVAAKGNSTTQVDYELNDNTPVNAWNYYRVKQFDASGKDITGNVAGINMQQAYSVLAVYPNPVRAALTVSYTAAKAEKVQVRVLDSKGILVYQSGFTAQNGGNLYRVPTSGLAKGIYVLQLIADSGSTTERFIKD